MTNDRSGIGPGSRLYCTAEPDLSPGALLKPSEFRRRLLDRVVLRMECGELAAPEPGWTGVVMMELAWETVRLREFPARPGRLDCLYLWETEAKASDFFSRRPWPAGLYEVEVVACDRVFVANMDLTSYFEDPETGATMMDRARRYWSAAPEPESESREVLLDGTARVVRRLG